VTVIAALVVFVKVAEKKPTLLAPVRPSIPEIPVGANQEYVVLAGTISPFTLSVGETEKLTPLQVVTTFAPIPGIE
jgi:hypothetical protein